MTYTLGKPRSDWLNRVRTLRDERHSRALIGRTALRTPRDVRYSRALVGRSVTYAIAVLRLVEA